MFARGRNELNQWLQQGAKIIDVRTQMEYVGFHIPGAVNIPYDEIDHHTEEIKSWDSLVVIYSTYGLRSELVAKKLQRNGIPAIATTRDRLSELLAI
jgi:rhodanese-related sulfurtransferase